MQGLAGLGYEVVEQPMLDNQHGIPEMKNAADMLADFGRYGDTYVVHAAEGETVVPLEVLDANPKLKSMLFSQMQEMGIEPERYIVGNELNSINPVTGQPEFFLKKLFKGIKKAVKKVGSVLKKIAPIVLPIVAPFLLPAMPIAFATGLGSLAGGLISGQSLKDSLKGAVISGGLAGLGNMAFRDGGTFFGSKAAAGGQLGDVGLREAFSFDNPFTAAVPDAVGAAQQAVADRTAAAQAQYLNTLPQEALGDIPVTGPEAVAPVDAQLMTPDAQTVATNVVPDAPNLVVPDAPNLAPSVRPSLTDALKQTVTPGDNYGITDFYSDYLSPSREAIQPNMAEVTTQAAQDAATEIAATNTALTNAGLEPLTQTAQDQIFQSTLASATKKAGPTLLAKYGPLAGTAVGAGLTSDALLGTNIFSEPEIGPPGLVSRETGFDYLERDPLKYGFDRTKFFGDNPYYQGFGQQEQVAAMNPVDPSFVPAYTADNFVNPYLGPMSRSTMPLRAQSGGEIVGPGTGTSDSIPALLSDGEFVLTAQAVRNAGNGDRRKGAQKMYDFMRSLENGAA